MTPRARRCQFADGRPAIKTAPLLAYAETSALSHLHDRIGVTDADEDAIHRAIADGRLRFILSPATLEEVLAIAEHDGPKAAEFVRFVVALGDQTKLVKQPPPLLMDEIERYATGSPSPGPYFAAEASLFEGLARDAAARSEGVLAFLREARRQKAAFTAACVPGLDMIRGRAKELRSGRPGFAEFRAKHDVQLIGHAARRVGAWDGVQARGVDGLMRCPVIRAYVGPSLSLLYAVMFDGWVPKESDWRDLHHVLMAAPAGVFVTDDSPLRTLLARVTDLPFQVRTLPEFAAWARR